jgi:hypothetical protein
MLSSTLKIRPRELRMATLLTTLFALVQLGCSVGGSAADAIFFKRFGVNHLPNMYLILGGLNFTALIGYFALLGRWTNKGRLFTSLFTGFASVLLAERLAIVLNVRELYPLLWLSVNILSLLLGILLWSTAGEICDTRQAKRLFPLFASAGIFGWLIGSLLTGPVARLFGTENLIVLDVVVLIAATLVLRTITSRCFPRTQQGTAHANIMADLRAGYDLVRQSPMLQLLGSLAVLFSVLYFAVAFPFGKSVAAAFSNEADMAGYLGLFSGVTSAIALEAVPKRHRPMQVSPHAPGGSSRHRSRIIRHTAGRSACDRATMTPVTARSIPAASNMTMMPRTCASAASTPPPQTSPRDST